MTLITGYQGRGYCVLSTDLRTVHLNGGRVTHDEKLWKSYSGDFYFSCAGTMDAGVTGRILHRSFRENTARPLRTFAGSVGLTAAAVVIFIDGYGATLYQATTDTTPRRVGPNESFCHGLRYNEDGINPYEPLVKERLTTEVVEGGPESIADALHGVTLRVGELERSIEGAATFVFKRYHNKGRVRFDGVE